MTPAGQVGEVAVVDPEASRDGEGETAHRHTVRGHGRELWLALASGNVRLLTDLPDLVIPPFLGRPNVWCVTSGENGERCCESTR